MGPGTEGRAPPIPRLGGGRPGRGKLPRGGPGRLGGRPIGGKGTPLPSIEVTGR